MMKRMFAVLLAVLLVFSLTITAYALEGEDAAAETESAQTESSQTEPVQTEPVTYIPTALEIDNENVYEGMDKAYKDGYVPTVKNGVLYIVLPLVSNAPVYGNKINVSLDLDTSASSPFVVTNYNKTFSLEAVQPKNSQQEKEVYLVAFSIALASGRVNGVYPIMVNVSGYDASGVPIDCIYTLYATITDGKSAEVAEPAIETPTAEPVVYISGSSMEPETAMAGEEFTLTLTLKNSLTTKSVRNMLVKVDTGNLQLALREDTNIFQIEEIAAGGEAKLALRFAAEPSTPAGKYTLNFQFNYDSSKTLNLSSAGTAVVEIRQPANMELVMPRFSDSVTVGETVPLSLQVMNMGRDSMYNVRCVVSGFGFAPSNTGYIGTMAAGSSATTDIDLYIIALNASDGNENGSQYGDTVGTVTLIYEDESGTEYSQQTQFETTVNRQIASVVQAAPTEEEEAKAASQWWISVLILGGVIVAAGIGAVLVRHKKKKRGGAYL